MAEDDVKIHQLAQLLHVSAQTVTPWSELPDVSQERLKWQARNLWDHRDELIALLTPTKARDRG